MFVYVCNHYLRNHFCYKWQQQLATNTSIKFSFASVHLSQSEASVPERRESCSLRPSDRSPWLAEVCHVCATPAGLPLSPKWLPDPTYAVRSTSPGIQWSESYAENSLRRCSTIQQILNLWRSKTITGVFNLSFALFCVFYIYVVGCWSSFI